MSATQAVKETGSSSKAQEVGGELANEAEFQALLRQLDDAERKYKLGDVDEDLKPARPGVRWAFEYELNEIEKLVTKHQQRLLAEFPADYYKFLAIQAEAKEYYDTATPTYRHDLFLLAKQLYQDLPKRYVTYDEPERRRLKNIIRVIIAGLDYLHSVGDFGTAITYGYGLYDFVVNRGLATKDDPAQGTLAAIYYFLGRSLRQRGSDDDYQKAIDYFYECSEAYFEMAHRRGNRDVDIVYARTRAMVSLAFGAGFLFYVANSDLARAKALIAQARLAFLKDNGDVCCKLHYHYVELLYASILRAEAGELDPLSEDGNAQLEGERLAAQEKLHRAREILDRCAEVFRNRHKYLIHVLFNQAWVYIYQGRDYYGQARKCTNELLERCHDNPRWLANGLVLKSHLERRSGDPDTALADALTAFNHAGNHLPVRIEALLARGQAQLMRKKPAEARADFEKALQLNSGANIKLATVANLLLVETAIQQQQPSQAFDRFAQLGTVMPTIRHGFILKKHREIEAKLKDLQTDFFIAGNTEELHYKRLESDLQRWLLKKALREDNNLTRVAQRLQVSKKTVYMWLEKYAIRN